MTGGSATELLLRRDRWIVGGGLLLICALCWAWLLAGSGTGMSVAAMTSWQFPPPATRGEGSGSWSMGYWLVMLCMWWTMMVAMMVPSAAPMILLYARVYRHGQASGAGFRPAVPVAAFAAGYLLAWLLFSALATGLQFALEQSGLLHRMLMWSTTPLLSGAFLVVAGLYQFSPWKDRCLRHCRSPATFLSTHWRKSRAGALRMGIDHGLYCVGCCWSLMLLLFVGGVMNLVWIAGLAVLVLLEKLYRFGHWVARGAGLLMVAGGVYLL